MTLAIRKATLEDAEILTALRITFLQEIGELSSPGNEIEQATSQYLKEKIPGGGFVAWVADAEGELVATSGLVFFEHPPFEHNLSGKDAFILNMYTLPQWRGKGLATRLLHELLAYARQAGARRIWLYATEDGKPVYEKAGFMVKQRESLEMELCW